MSSYSQSLIRMVFLPMEVPFFGFDPRPVAAVPPPSGPYVLIGPIKFFTPRLFPWWCFTDKGTYYRSHLRRPEVYYSGYYFVSLVCLQFFLTCACSQIRFWIREAGPFYATRARAIGPQILTFAVLLVFFFFGNFPLLQTVSLLIFFSHF